MKQKSWGYVLLAAAFACIAFAFVVRDTAMASAERALNEMTARCTSNPRSYSCTSSSALTDYVLLSSSADNAFNQIFPVGLILLSGGVVYLYMHRNDPDVPMPDARWFSASSFAGKRKRTPEQELRNLDDLRRNGVINEREYEQLKSDVLGNDPPR